MKVLLTGGSGFIGGNLAKKLVKKNYKVRALVRNSSNVNELKQLGVELCYGDLSDSTALRNASEGVEVVYPCAALVSDWGKYEDFYEVNVQGTKNLLDACVENNVRKIVYISTTDVVWNYEDHINLTESANYYKIYKHPYCKTKAEAEKEILSYKNQNKIETTIIRPCLVWGPGDRVVLPKIVDLAINNSLYLFGSGRNLISICYIENVTDAIILAGENHKSNGEIYFINDDLKITFQEYISKLLSSLEIEWKPKKIPYFIVYNIARLLEFLTIISGSKKYPLITTYVVAAMGKNLNYSIDKARLDLNYKPKINLHNGLINLKAWVNEIGGIENLVSNK